MKVDKTTTVSGGELYGLDLETIDVTALLTPTPLLVAEVLPTTVSVSHMFIDSADAGYTPGPDPDDETNFYGVPSMTLGFGGAPPYNACYPIGGI